MIIALYTRYLEENARHHFNQLVEILQKYQIEYDEVSDPLPQRHYDFLFSIGGDGTLLSSVHLLGNRNIPVLGINFGHLGFLTAAGKESVGTLVDELLQGHYTLETRSLLEVNGGYALNEVFLHRSDASSLLRTEVTVDSDYVATYAGDGVIVATPTGSTAYSLSCGGPILTPDSRCLVITPVCAHTLTLRPIIVPDTATVVMRVDGAENYTLGIDSRRTTLHGSTQLTLRRAPFSINLVRTGSQSFFSAIRDKLSWGS